eukprot:TRINITY_DN7724_c0_g1_i2.p1 TRINITY_DN7724_c0_g1~~TRINITY_DN7724_c0_g1_i2.p1  ORF type:complete len:282 (-),score=106.36 TRINITY_DN7724_c0_g1_i2:138-983(-)
MAERKAVNKYYPPEWTPDKGSINTFVGQHPLRDRARKLGQGIMIIRFEMPYNFWCGGCDRHIARGVRFNAEKKKIGKYFSTPIYQFRMKCASCSNWIEIHTDPQHADYIVVGGGKWKNEKWEAGPEETGTVLLKDDDEAKRLAEDPFYKLEHQNVDVARKEDLGPVLNELLELRESRADDYTLLSIARKTFRDKKKELQALAKEGEAKGLSMPLLPPSEQDKLEASTVQFTNGHTPDSISAKRRLEIRSKSIFDGKSGESEAARLLKLQMIAKKRKLVLKR